MIIIVGSENAEVSFMDLMHDEFSMVDLKFDSVVVMERQVSLFDMHHIECLSDHHTSYPDTFNLIVVPFLAILFSEVREGQFECLEHFCINLGFVKADLTHQIKS